MKTPYEKLIRMMQESGKVHNPPRIRIADVTQGYPSTVIIRLGEIDYEETEEELISLIHFRSLEAGDQVAVYELTDDLLLVLGKVVSG